MASMTGLQLLWLGVIWVTGTASNAWKLPLLLVHTVIAGAFVLLLPANAAIWLDNQAERFTSGRRGVLIGLAAFVAVFGMIYAGTQEILTDEAFLLQASRILADEGVHSFFADYGDIKWLGGQHPPLTPLVYGSAMRAFGPDLLALRAIATLVTALTVVVTYFLGEAWFDRRAGFMGALFLVSMPYCLRMGTAVLTDMPVTFLLLLGLFLMDRLSRTPSFRLSIAAGVAIGLGLLSKYTMLLIYPVLFCQLLARPRFRRAIGHISLSVLVSIAIWGVWLQFAFEHRVLVEQAETVSRYAGGVTGGGWRYMIEMITTELPSAVGFYNLPLVLWGTGCALYRRSEADLALLLWIVPVFVIVALTLPDPRYFMPAFPGIAIAMARGSQRFGRSDSRIVLLALLLCAGSLYLFADWSRAAFLFLP